jgi:hypothetical protein
VGIILGEFPHSQEPVKNSGSFMTMNQSQLKISLGQIPVTPDRGVINQHVREAIHRLYAVRLLVDLRKVHVLTVMVEVTGLFP